MADGHFRLRLLAGLAVTGALLLAGCGGTQTHSGMGVSWAGSASSLQELSQQADAIVQGQVTAVADTGIHPTSSGRGYPFTDFNVDVTRWLKGSTGESSITVHQTGGEDASGSVIAVDDDPLMQVDDQAILFLRQYAPGHYAILWGPTGRFPIDQGTVAAMAGGDVQNNLPEDVSSFVSAVSANVKK